MPYDLVKPLKIEQPPDGTESESYPSEADPTEDYITGKGFAYENNENQRSEIVENGITFIDNKTGENKVQHLRFFIKELFIPLGELLTIPINNQWACCGGDLEGDLLIQGDLVDVGVLQ